jgi:RNA polymerase sigma-70 factor (ECF subfamily)
VNLSDPRQFERAYNTHAARVRAAALRVLSDPAAAEDVAQEVFIRLWQRPHLFDPRRGSLAAFLSVMARSRALDKLRADSALDRARERLAGVHAVAPAADDGPADALLRSEERAELRAAVLRLPPAQRDTVALAYGGELSSAEIGRRMSCGRATARSRLRLGLGKLRADLGEAAA